ncbi:hypothetical protein ACTPDI_19575 [Clostridioides difficile]
MNIEIVNNASSTLEALTFFDNYKAGFGEVINARMDSNPDKIEYKLTLTNNRGERMIINKCCTAGYNGEGCRGTLKILTECGFEVTREFIAENTQFELER